jgi:adenylate cyclase class 2
MNTEIEVKFLNIEFDDIRTRLQAIGAQCEQPMRLMRRAIFATPGMDEQRNAFIRVRDEGHRTTVTYKQFDEISLTGAKEIEVQVSDFESMLAILAKTDMRQRAYQESRRETWQIGDVEVVLDEWPWLTPFIEIEGASEERVREVAGQLGFAWEDAVFGAVTQAYEVQYPNTRAADIIMTPEIKFELPLPDILKEEVTA